MLRSCSSSIYLDVIDDVKLSLMLEFSMRLVLAAHRGELDWSAVIPGRRLRWLEALEKWWLFWYCGMDAARVIGPACRRDAGGLKI
ncbi:hypothetical protein Nepgr_023024 [Nepenthes gracilis]|uniref:Uncharacterized protein n=1 Tax=Nepenthes gracilis TaxID=150966 RepID=A0AAD3T341_NEPGR|nr:hypothetical protein Nepgr_023024 [Nepenthes gracilis]